MEGFLTMDVGDVLEILENIGGSICVWTEVFSWSQNIQTTKNRAKVFHHTLYTFPLLIFCEVTKIEKREKKTREESEPTGCQYPSNLITIYHPFQNKTVHENRLFFAFILPLKLDKLLQNKPQFLPKKFACLLSSVLKCKFWWIVCFFLQNNIWKRRTEQIKE
jgi:hypothetical protein